MKTQWRIFNFTLISFLASSSIWALPEGITELKYHYGGNFKAWVSYPQKAKSAPVIVYNYDEYWDWTQDKEKAEKTYPLTEIMKTFSKWGYICIVPIERYRKAYAITGAIGYAKTHFGAQNKIYLVGVSEGAYLAVIGLKVPVELDGIVLITPSSIHPYGPLSDQVALQMLQKNAKSVLYLVATKDPNWKIQQTLHFYELLKQTQFKVLYKEYPQNHMWFWDPNNSFMIDIYEFITQQKAPLSTVL
jgi:dienelactone hydrolase